ncbi:MAG: PSD1 domain-containing protein [Bryobacterales bacterium]|nr:PSD1 domain-containing protein [Bryobacterales bacterium]
MRLFPVAMAVGAFACMAVAADDPAEFFESKVRPLLAKECYACHTQTAMGGLRLDSRASFVQGGKSGAAVVAGKPDESLLIQAVRRTHARLKMPPTAPLAATDVELLTEWVKRGAVYPETTAAAAPPAAAGYTITPAQRAFWSFQPVRKPALPALPAQAAARTPIDHFLLARLAATGIKPAPDAGRRTWLRRASLALTGLPPTPEEVNMFLRDTSPKAFETVVERLLASPHYGERWGRHWLDLARYSDGQLAAGTDTPFPNAFRYRDWVVNAFNQDMPYDRFVTAQIAADLLPAGEGEPLLGGLGFQALGSRGDDQVDVTTKVFLGLTVGCAQCHDHKYDPIPTRDYYALLGVFRSTQITQHPLAPEADVKRYLEQKKRVDAMKETIDDFVQVQQKMLVDTLARHTARYMVAAWQTHNRRTVDSAGLDAETLARWVEYLKNPEREHPYLKSWFALMKQNPTEEQVRAEAARYQAFALKLIDDAKEVEDKNYVAFGGRKGIKNEATRQYTNIVSLSALEFYQWRELASGHYNVDGYRAPAGVYYYSAKELDRWLGGNTLAHLHQLRAELKALESELPPAYPFLHTLKDADKPADARIAIRGDAQNLGAVAPRAFLEILSPGKPEAYREGSGRLQLARAIASPSNPLTARVIVNRLWHQHFGQGLVRTTSNFGQMGERPSNPELLDYLAARLVESGWSLKAIQREIVLSAAYSAGTQAPARAAEADPDNRLLSHFPTRPRLDMESLRDSVLAVTGKLDRAVGGPAKPIADDNHRRSLYLTVSRTRLDPTFVLFDFPDANATAEQRPVTVGPLQGLFFLNSPFIARQAEALNERVQREAGDAVPARIDRAYQLLYGRAPDADELKLGIEYVTAIAGGKAGWRQYLQALLGSAEFTSVN